MFKYILSLMLFFGFCFYAMADNNKHNEKHHDTAPIINVTEVTNVTNNNYNGQMALAGATAHAATCDFGTYSLQGSVGFSTYKGTQAASFGLCQRYKRIMVSVSITQVEGEDDPMISGGIHFRF